MLGTALYTKLRNHGRVNSDYIFATFPEIYARLHNLAVGTLLYVNIGHIRSAIFYRIKSLVHNHRARLKKGELHVG